MKFYFITSMLAFVTYVAMIVLLSMSTSHSFYESMFCASGAGIGIWVGCLLGNLRPHWFKRHGN